MDNSDVLEELMRGAPTPHEETMRAIEAESRQSDNNQRVVISLAIYYTPAYKYDIQDRLVSTLSRAFKKHSLSRGFFQALRFTYGKIKILEFHHYGHDISFFVGVEQC